MLGASLVQQLKQNNISKEADKTKQRFEEIWKAASSSDKKAVEELAGVARASMQRVYKMGSISAKIVVAASQVLKVNPYYLTGEADEAGESSDEILLEFLEKLGYQELLAKSEKEQKTRKPRKKRESKVRQVSTSATSPDSQNDDDADEASQAFEPIEEIIIIQEEPCEDIAPALFFDEFDEEDIILLLRSVKIRAKAGVAEAIKQSEELRKILIS